MTYTPTRETLELAALACGKTIYGFDKYKGVITNQPYDPRHIDYFDPSQKTQQGKADLLDMIDAVSFDIEWHYANPVPKIVSVSYYIYEGDTVVSSISEAVKVTNGNKHAALMEAALKVAAKVGEKMRSTT